MNIIFFLHAPYIGGVEQMSLHLLDFLKEKADLKVYCSLPSFTEILNNKKIPAKTIKMGRKIGGHLSFLLCLVTSPFFLLKYFFLLLKDLPGKKETVIILQTLNEKFVVTPLACFLGFKTIWIDHGPLSKWISGLPLKFYKFFSKFCHKIIAVSSVTKDNLISFGVEESRIEVIYNGISLKKEPNEFIAKSDSGFFTFGFMNRIIPEKGPQIILKSLTLLDEETLSNIKILFGGIGYYQEKLLDYVGENSLQNNVSFSGWQEDKDSFYQKLDCFINPSLYEEGFGLTILEAWRNKIPVIASRKGAFLELIENEENGLFFEPNDAKDLALKIKFFVTYQEAAEKMGTKGYNTFTNRFTSEIMGERYWKQIQQLVK